MGVCCIVFDIDGMLFEVLAPLCHRSGAFQMPTRLSSSPLALSTLRGGGGGGGNLRNASVTFSLFGMKLFRMTLTTYNKKDLVESL